MSLKYWVKYGAEPKRARSRLVAGGARLAALLLLAGWGLSAAQTSGGESARQAEGQPDTSLPTVTQATTRAELLDLLDRVQTQLEEVGADAPPGAETDARLTELRSQLELLLLQAQLERLQRENADLQKQLVSTAQGEEPDAAALEQQLTQLRARQDNMNTQMEVISHQHAEILEYAEVEPEGEAQTYTVQPGDSLSKLAQTYYNSMARWPDILAANPEVTDPDKLFPGTELVIPALPEAEPAN